MSINKKIIETEAAAPSVNAFNTVLYTGNGSTQSITGVGFQPDLVWAKHRNHGTAHSHNWADSTRGGTKIIYSNTTDAQQTITNSIQTFDTGGFTVGNSAAVNDNGINYVAWCWKANGGTTVTNTDGSITSTVQANQDAGFSIVKCTASGNADTIGHGLSQAPEMIIYKTKSATGNWSVYHSALGNTKGVYLNLTSAAVTSQYFWNNTSPTSSVFTAYGNATNEQIAYCFHSVAGYSKIGSYSTNASTKVSTGFQPDFILMKYINNANDWFICDSVRSDGTTGSNGGNLVKPVLYGNLSNAEHSVSTGSVEIVSDGFYPTNFFNLNGVLYIAFKI